MKKQLTLTLMMLLVAASSFAVQVEIGGLWYEVISKTKGAKVIMYKNDNKYSGDIVISSTVEYNGDNYSVTSIDWYAFSGCSGLTSVTIPNGVTSIDWGAFAGCSGLTSVTIPNSVTSIGNEAFRYCDGLTSVTIGNGVTSIGEAAFWGCSCLTSVTIPNSVTAIGNDAFYYCSGLTSVTIPNSVTSIGNYAFYYCSGLTSVTIPNSVTSIGNYAFQYCSGLTSVTIPNSVTSIGSSAFRDCSGLTSVTIPNSVTSIGNYAFSHCSGLTSVTIPNSVTSIGESAFSGCSGLTSVTIPNSVISIGKRAFEYCSGLTSVTIPNSVTSIGNYVFYKCSGLTSVAIPNSVTAIDGGAFKGCGGLTSVTISGGVKTIGSGAFASCAELTDVYCYAENVPTTDTDAFSDSYIEYATLHVPAASVTSYNSTTPWSSFGTIIGAYYGLSITAGSHGTVSYNNQSVTNGSASFYVDEGANAVLTITPETGYKIATLTVNDTDAMSQLNNGSLTISNVTANTTVSVTFAIAGETEAVTIGAAGMATFCSSKDLDFSEVEGLKAYTGAAFNRNTGALTMLEVKDVPAGTGLIVVGNAGSYDVPVSNGSFSVYANLLKGVSTATNLQQTANGYTNYILGSGAQGTGFYVVSAGGGTLAAGKAYLQIPTAATNSRSAISMEFVEGTTDISEHKAEPTTESYYTLSGQRTTSKPQKPGIYVKNGRKMIIK